MGEHVFGNTYSWVRNTWGSVSSKIISMSEGGGVGEVRGERAWLEAAASSPSTPWAGAGDAGVAPFAVFIVSRSRPSGAG